MDQVNSTYEHKLAAVYHEIDKRGILFDEPYLAQFRSKLVAQSQQLLQELSQNWGLEVGLTQKAEFNLNSPKQLLERLKNMGFKLPLVRRKNKETHETSFEESVEELVLRKIFASTADTNIKRVLDIRELNTLKSRYIDSRRYNGVFYSNYKVTATVTGRRGCSKHIFGYGGNAQTFPKHYDLSEEFRKGIIARPGKLFFIVDQMSAEDWPVSALAENKHALKELDQQVDRHTNLAAFIFNIPLASKTQKEWKSSIERYLGKKTRHANNYGMRGQTFSDSLAKEGFAYPKANCDELLRKVNEYDPSIEGVFHKYVRNKIYSDYTLRTPFGRERHFHGLRDGSPNYEIFNEAFSFIPQSTVGDNTGFAILSVAVDNDYTINECHDSITAECPESERELRRVYTSFRKSFDRSITFHNGIRIRIPIEGELGYNLAELVKIKDWSEEGVLSAWKELQDKYTRRVN